MCKHHMQKNGIITYDKKSIIRTICGGVLLGVGVVTLPLPTGSIVLIMVGAGMIGYDIRALWRRVRYEAHLIKVRFWR